MRNIFFILLFLIEPNTVSSQPVSVKGQLWASGLTGNDPSADRSSFESQLGYIPTLSLLRDIDKNSFMDLEWGYRLERMYSGDSLIYNAEKPYRLWARYSGERVEARIGLQKVSFGPAMILRTLAWFDTIDPKDPTGQTDGVESFRLRVFPTNSLAIWGWTMNSEQDTLSYGGRAEVSNGLGEWGLTYHWDPSKAPQLVGQFPVLIGGPHQRAAIDYRFDGYLGFWFEGAAFFGEDQHNVIMDRYLLLTLGADHTIPIGPGLLIMSETMRIQGWSSNDTDNSEQTYTAFMASLPINMLNQLMLITQVDWDNERIYNYLRWSITFDHLSFNFLLSINPKRDEYNISQEYLPKTVAGFGTGLQFMLIFNH